MHVTKITAIIPTTPELIAEQADIRAGYQLMHRIMSGTATPEEITQYEARKAADKAETDQRRTTAITEWQQLRERYADMPAVIAVLDIHRPDGSDHLECELSEEDELPTDWPCSTYQAIRNAVTGGN